ncbi:MAG: endopeptidase La [Parachlamydiaceae bacterium]|nr:endopeptidase La [Parachlamydiaceae bacterium]
MSEYDDSSFEKELENEIIFSLENMAAGTEKIMEAPPKDLFIVPIIRRPFFPGMAAPLVIEPGPYYDAIKKIAKSKHKFIGLILSKKDNANVYDITFDDLHHMGVLARILRVIPMEQGGAQIVLNMEKRFEIEVPKPDSKVLFAQVKYFEDDPVLTLDLKAYAISIISTIKELLKLNPLFKEELQIFLGHSDFTEPGKLADFSVALTTATREELQDVLETLDIPSRIEKALILLKKELDISILQNDINKKIEATINKSQKDYFLREQLKAIKKELGLERDDKSLDREKFESRLKDKMVPPDIMKVIQDELEKLSVIETQSSEYNLTRNYLDWLTITPWGVFTEEHYQLETASKILNHDHYGLEDVKKRILEFISVGKLSGGIKGSIICLVGPPGVGKTSIGKSIARALNRKFYRFSVGGMRDEAEIKGHRRTYVGAMPGKMIQALKYCQTMNPVIMLDEVDKMGRSFQGDPASALLEVLDPEQNSEFLDHYLDVRCDLSNVLFIVTANVLDTIPDALRDRMEVLRLSGYIMQEKMEIAKKYLIPRHRKEMGLKATDIAFTSSGLKTIINGYAREAGVRQFENAIKKVMRKLAMEIVSKQQRDEQLNKDKKKSKKTSLPQPNKTTIDEATVKDYLGKPIFLSDSFYDENPVGVCTGLAWTAMGGATLYIESIKIPGEKTSMKLTGQAGDVMKESSQIAWSYLHGAIRHYAPEYTFFEKQEVHMHIPEGAIPKDGPSAGITMVTSLLSLLMNTPVLDKLGMTGELTLTGKVLPIGGVKEKVISAKRSGLKTLIFPKANLRDYEEELPENIRKGLTIHFVDHYDEVFAIAFPKKRS